MTQITRELAAAFPVRDLAGTVSQGYEYHLRAPLDSEFGELGSMPSIPLQDLEACDLQARARWRQTLLSVRRALGTRY